MLVLVQNSGHVVEKSILMKQVWPDVTVEENNLTQNVSLLRKTLGASGDDRGFIETIPRRGYRFVAPVKAVAQTAPTPPDVESEPPQRAVHDSRRWLQTGVLLLLVLVPGVVIAFRYFPQTRPAPILRQLTTNSTELPLATGAISPDGNYLAYADPAGLHVKLLKTRETHLLTSPPEVRITTVRWFGDSATLVVSGISERDSKSGIWVCGLINEAPRQLSDNGLQATSSPDGSQIAFVSADSHELWLMDANGQAPHRILTAKLGESLAGPQWIPSGERIGFAFFYGTRDTSGKTALQLDLGSIDRQGQNPVRIPFDAGLTGGASLPGRFVYALRRAPLADWGETTLWERTMDPGFREFRGADRRIATLGAGVTAFDFSATAGGRQLVFLKGEPQSDVYIAELEQKEKRLLNTRRLTLDDHNDILSSWSLDSRAVLFFSDRNGNFDVYRQFIDGQIAQPIVAGPRDETVVKVSPEGAYYFYVVQPDGWKSTATRPITWMKIPVAGGAPQAALPGPVAGEIDCALPPSRVCVLIEYTAADTELVVHAFDAQHGKGSELGRTGTDRWHFNALSPDGSRLAIALEDRVRILTLGAGSAGGKPFEDVTAPSWKPLKTISWAPDGSGFYVTAFRPAGRTAILYMDLQGHAWPLSDAPGEFDSPLVPSPDGRRLAFTRWSSANNAWMLER